MDELTDWQKEKIYYICKETCSDRKYCECQRKFYVCDKAKKILEDYQQEIKDALDNYCNKIEDMHGLKYEVSKIMILKDYGIINK